MKAAFYDSQGSAASVLTVAELETPKPRDGEVLVRLRASGVNPSDVKLRSGARPGGMPFPRIVPHSDGAGVIEAVGRGVDGARIGQRVWIWNGQWQRPFGTAAEYIALPAIQAVPLPDNTAFEAGACFGIPALTAQRTVFADGPVEGQTVLVTGGAGSVARYAIQMAKLGGAQVITTVSGPEKAAHARSAGADHILNYRDEDVATAVMDITNGRGVERIVELEFGANLETTAKVIAPNGVIAAYGSAANMNPTFPFADFLFKDVTLRIVLVYRLTPAARRQGIEDLTRWLLDGRLTHAVARTFTLDDCAKAHELVESAGKLGSVVVTL
ncbi:MULTISPECIES: NADPH:quinone reductase [Limibacillus]|jgi:NADPH2:quinone reductase|uniref:NADPH2:quinone reductase n=1 Tax=Limibacillus halophilus TaxID=1579333 RepID=A0A839SVA9_9PROT|nr:NADPH:quinone reductase [Limibacillus halophilus]MBB3066741.1 NADPH2:quinone reductase [Limibacillus halophilus]